MTVEAFEKERVLIGEGKVAKVYLWHDFAYKCFKSGYPESRIADEVKVQNTVCETGLPVVRYYPSEFPNSIKMDYIDGISLADRMRKQKYSGGLSDLFGLMLKIHEYESPELYSLKPCLLRETARAGVSDKAKAIAARYITEIPDAKVLCHLDFHFLNVMHCSHIDNGNSEDSWGGYRIIDWASAKCGNPIFDFAGSYVIMYEFAYRLSGPFYKMVLKRCDYSEEDFQKAAFVMTVHRLAVCDSPKVHRLFDKLAADGALDI